MNKVNLSEKFNFLNEYKKQKIIAEVNDTFVKIARLKGEFIWHHHKNEDELFFVVKGSLTIRLKDKDIKLNEGEFFVDPKGVEHKPVADEEVEILLIEPRSTINTGNILNEITVENEWI